MSLNFDPHKMGGDETSSWGSEQLHYPASEQPGSGQAAHLRSARPSAEHWNAAALQDHLIRGFPLEDLPLSIDFSTYAECSADLSKRSARTGCEHGCMAYVDHASRSIELGATVQGDERSIVLPSHHPQLGAPVMWIHTHPVGPAGAAHEYHLSLQDFKTFMEVESLQVAVMITRGLTLLAVKTSLTPNPSTEISAALEALEYLAVVNYGARDARALPPFTRDACKFLNLGLYRIKHSESGHIARFVELGPK